jgi:hypothetical protein
MDTEIKFIDYLFTNDLLDFDKIIKKYVDDSKSDTTYSLLKKVVKDYKNTQPKDK